MIGQVEGFTGERGFTDVLSPASPAAGANYSFTVGGLNVDYLRVVSCIATLATDASVANRLFSLDYLYRGATAAVRNAAAQVSTANTAATVYQWDHAHAVSDWGTGTPIWIPLADVLLTPGWTVQLTVDNKQAGDAITAITFVLEKFYADTLNGTSSGADDSD